MACVPEMTDRACFRPGQAGLLLASRVGTSAVGPRGSRVLRMLPKWPGPCRGSCVRPNGAGSAVVMFVTY